MTTNQPLSSLLAQVASVAAIRSSSLGLTRLDREASKQSDAAHGAQAGTVRANVARLTPAGIERVKAINAKVAEVGLDLKSMTTAWNDMRLLSNALLQNWYGKWGNHKKEYDALVEAFVNDAPQLLEAAAQNLQGFAKVQPPTKEEIEEAFSMTFDIQQIPDAASYRPSGIDVALEKAMKRQFEAGIEAAYANATQDALERVAKPLSHMIDRLKKYNDGDTKRLYDSTIGNVQDIAKVFAEFNLTGNPLMDKIANQLDSFDGIEAEDLKSSKDLRDHVTKKAEEILAELSDLI